MKKLEANFRPSNLNRYSKCPYAYQVEIGIVDDGNVFSKEGQMLHERVVSEDMTGLTDEQIQQVEKCITIKKQLIEHKAYGFEKKIAVKIDGEEIINGTIDLYSIDRSNRTGIILDWKFGRGSVEAVKDNWQLAMYSLALMLENDLDRVDAMIYQPRVSRLPSEFSFTDREALKKSLLNLAESCTTAKIPTPCDMACRYCKGKLSCPAMTTNISSLAVVTHPNSLSKENFKEIMAKWEIAKEYGKLLEAYRKTQIEANGGHWNGYEYEETSNGCELKDAKTVFQKLAQYFTINEFIEIGEWSDAQLRTALVAKLKIDGTKKVVAEQLYKDLLGDLRVAKAKKKNLIEVA